MCKEIELNNDKYLIYEGCEFGDVEMECYYDKFYVKVYLKDYDDIEKKVNKEFCNGFFFDFECFKNCCERIIEKKVSRVKVDFFKDKGGWKNELIFYAKCGI